MAKTLHEHPEVVEAWSVTGEADAIARVRTEDNADLERLIMDLQRNGLVVRTRSQVVLSRLVSRGAAEPVRRRSGPEMKRGPALVGPRFKASLSISPPRAGRAASAVGVSFTRFRGSHEPPADTRRPGHADNRQK